MIKINNERTIIVEKNKNVILNIVKDYTAQLALALPLIFTLSSIGINFILYISKKGYYSYFNIADSYILYNKSITLYRVFVPGSLTIIFAVYATFTMLTLINHRNKLKKATLIFIIPYIISFVFSYYSYNFSKQDDKLIALCVCLFISLFLSVLISILVVITGIFMLKIFYPDTLKSRKTQKKKTQLSSEKRESKLMSLVVCMCLIMFYILVLYLSSYFDAKTQTNFTIVKTDRSYYAIIASNKDTILVEPCKIDLENNILIIDTSYYKKISNRNIKLHECMFSNVKKKTVIWPKGRNIT